MRFRTVFLLPVLLIVGHHRVAACSRPGRFGELVPTNGRIRRCGRHAVVRAVAAADLDAVLPSVAATAGK